MIFNWRVQFISRSTHLMKISVRQSFSGRFVWMFIKSSICKDEAIVLYKLHVSLYETKTVERGSCKLAELPTNSEHWPIPTNRMPFPHVEKRTKALHTCNTDYKFRDEISDRSPIQNSHYPTNAVLQLTSDPRKNVRLRNANQAHERPRSLQRLLYYILAVWGSSAFGRIESNKYISRIRRNFMTGIRIFRPSVDSVQSVRICAIVRVLNTPWKPGSGTNFDYAPLDRYDRYLHCIKIYIPIFWYKNIYKSVPGPGRVR